MCNGGWCHLTSKDLLRWTAQNETAAHGNPLANGDTGSISFTEKGAVALFPTTQGPLGLMRQVPSGGGGLSAGVTWTNATKVFAATFDGARAGFRDPARAVKMSDGSYYVAVGAGVGKEGCIAWLKAADASLSSFSFTGCLLSTNHTTGHMESHHYGWDPRDQTVTFIECPDGTCSSALCVFSRQAPRSCCAVFPLGAADTYVAIGSFNNFNPKMQNGTTFQNNEYWIGSISDRNKFEPTSRGVLDCKCSRFLCVFFRSSKQRLHSRHVL